MKKIISALTLLSFIFMWALAGPIPKVPNATALSALPQLTVSEVMSTVASDEEWVEIYNSGVTNIGVSKLVFYENATNHGVTSFSGQSEIPASSIAIIANKADVFKSKHPDYTGILLDSTWSSLLENGETIAVKIDGVIVDGGTYGASTTGTSSQRDFATLAWTAAIPTPGQLSEAQMSFATAQPTTPEPNTPQVSTEVIDTDTHEIVPEPVTTPTVVTSETSESENQPIVVTITTTTTNIPVTPELVVNAETSTTTPETVSTLEVAAMAATTTPETTSAPAQAVATPQNIAPIAVIAIQTGSLTGAEKVSINFDGRGSYDPNGDALSFAWDFGDGSDSASSNPGVHSYTKVGTYVVRLTVTDGGGLHGVSSKEVVVMPKAGSAATATSATTITNSTTSAATQTKTQSILVPGTNPQSKSSPATSSSSITMTLSFEDAQRLFASYPLNSTDTRIAIANTTTSVASESEPTKGVARSPSGPIRLNEIFPAPPKGSDEWIEIANSGATAHNLGGWLLADESKLKKPFVFPSGTVIAPHGFLVITNKTSKISLNNGTDSVYLAEPDGTLADSVAYSGGGKEQSYVRVHTSTNDAWVWTDKSTRAKANGAVREVTGNVTAVHTKTTGDTTTPTIEVQDNSGNVHDITMSASDPNGVVTKEYFEPGSEVEITTLEDQNGTEHMAEIEKITPAVVQSSQPLQSSNTPLYIAVGILAAINIGIVSYLLYKNNKRHRPAAEHDAELAPDEEGAVDIGIY